MSYLLRKPLFKEGSGNWLNEEFTVTKQYNNKAYSSSNLTPIEASLKKKKYYVYSILLDKGRK